MKKYNFCISISLAILIMLRSACFLYFFDYLEIEKPTIKLNQELTAIGKQKTIEITFL